MVSELTADDIAALRELDPEVADVIHAQSLLTAGRTNEAQILVRRYPTSHPALQIRVEALRVQGRATEAIQALERHASRYGEEHLLVQAATLAMHSGLSVEAVRLSQEGIASGDPRRRRISHEILIDAAQRDSDWKRVIRQVRGLLDDDEIASSDPDRTENIERYRWALANAYFQDREFVSAYLSLDEQPPLVPTSEEHARLVLVILRSIAARVPMASGAVDGMSEGISPTDVINKATIIARSFADNEEILAGALMTTLEVPAEGEIDPALLLKSRELQEEFFGRFPDSHLLRAIPVDDNITNVTELLRTTLSPNAAVIQSMTRQASWGLLPYGVLAASVNRSYADALVRRAAHCYVIQHADQDSIDRETEAARRSLDGSIVIDTSSLFMSEFTMGTFSAVMAHFERLIVSTAMRDDILGARTSLMTRSSGSLGWDSYSDKPTMVQFSEETIEHWSAEGQRLVSLLDYCDVVPDAPHDGDDRNRVWSASIRLAQQLGLPLMADDAALRAVARSEQVAAFGSLQLLRCLVEDDLAAADAVGAAHQRLMQLPAAELSVNRQILEIASDEEWDPSGYAAFLLSRPTAWLSLQNGIQEYMTVIHGMSPKDPIRAAGWCVAAMIGASSVAPPAARMTIYGSLLGWTTVTLKGSEVLPALLTASERVVAELAPGSDLLEQVVRVITNAIRQIVPAELVAGMVLPLLEGLVSEEHQRAVGYFLATP